MIDEHPLPWLAPLLNGVEHANFFETRATEYSKAATRGNWGEVWDNFDKRQNAKAANDGAAEAAKADGRRHVHAGRGGGGVADGKLGEVWDSVVFQGKTEPTSAEAQRRRTTCSKAMVGR